MATSRLNKEELNQLIESLQSDLKVLRSKQDLIRDNIASLKADLKDAKSDNGQTTSKSAGTKSATTKTKAKAKTGTGRGSGRRKSAATAKTEKAAEQSAKTETKQKAEKKPTSRKAPATKKKGRNNTNSRSSGYRPSEFDLLVMESMEDRNRVTIASEMQDYIKEKFDKEGRKDMNDEKIKVMVTRSLQKLANRRDDLKKVRYEGRGWAYAQPKWVSANGEVKKKYQR